MFSATVMKISGLKRKGACSWDIFVSDMERVSRLQFLVAVSQSPNFYVTCPEAPRPHKVVIQACSTLLPRYGILWMDETIKPPAYEYTCCTKYKRCVLAPPLSPSFLVRTIFLLYAGALWTIRVLVLISSAPG
jgi:hypothetical protein